MIPVHRTRSSNQGHKLNCKNLEHLSINGSNSDTPCYECRMEKEEPHQKLPDLLNKKTTYFRFEHIVIDNSEGMLMDDRGIICVYCVY